jgi:hypothetical protein
VLSNAALEAVFANVRVDVTELELGEVVALNRRLERGLEAIQLLQRLLRLGLLRAN